MSPPERAMQSSLGRESVLGFVGVSTGGSSIRQIFPAWAEALGLPARSIAGHDVAPGAEPEVYRDLVRSVRDDPHHQGALVTTHKIALYEAAGDLFDEVDELAEVFTEVSCIAKRGGRLVASAKDPLTVRSALDDLVPADHFTGAADALVLGSGGAGTALAHELAARTDRPRQIICTSLDPGPLERATRVHQRAGQPADVVRHVLTPTVQDADRLLLGLAPGSLVVNATGMGKDRPGSPLSPAAVLPEAAVVWEFNYRGPRRFLHQALAQQHERGLRVTDGWDYFVHGWCQAIAEVFELEMTPQTVRELGRIAAGLRG